MRLGLVAVVLLAACGPMPEDTSAPSDTFPVRVSRLVVDQDSLQPSVDPLRLTLKVSADGVARATACWKRTAALPLHRVDGRRRPRAGLYHLDLTAQQSRWLAPDVLQLDQHWLTDDFAIEQ